MKRIIAIILTCILIASALSSCGNSGGTNEGRTLFIYMCGSNLETKQGLASKNIDELLAADKGDMAAFKMKKSYKELLKNPLPDGEYAAKVVKIEKYKEE